MATSTSKQLNTATRGTMIDQSDGTLAVQVTTVGAAVPTPAAAATPTTYKNTGASTTAASIKGTPGSVFSVLVTNANAAIRYFQLHNKATIPLAGETAQQSIAIPAGTAAQPAYLQLDVNWFAYQEYFTTGIGFAISTTDTTFTDAATSTEHKTIVRYS